MSGKHVMNQLAPRRDLSTTVLCVRLGIQLYALPIEAVDEVLPALPIERISPCPRFICGIVIIRGRLIPVLDAAERLGKSDHQRPLEPTIVCLRSGQRLVGVEFDEAIGLMELSLDELLSAAEVTTGSSFLKGFVENHDRIIHVLDPERIIAPDEAREIGEIA
jgi:purine-binding chemotaxis protein CheW